MTKCENSITYTFTFERICHEGKKTAYIFQPTGREDLQYFEFNFCLRFTYEIFINPFYLNLWIHFVYYSQFHVHCRCSMY